MITTLNAVADAAPFSITAALASKEMLANRSLMAAAGIAPTGRMTIAEVDAKLRDSRLSIEQRIAVKLVLTRCGILV